MMCMLSDLFFFFFNDTATTEIYTLSLHDALPISVCEGRVAGSGGAGLGGDAGDSPPLVSRLARQRARGAQSGRSEEHTSELQSQSNLVCRLLLEKKKNVVFISDALISTRGTLLVL